MSATVPRSLAAGLAKKDVVVGTKNGLVLKGKLLELEHEAGTVVIELDPVQPKPLPPHMALLDRVAIRGHAVAFLDFGERHLNLSALTRDAFAS